MTDLIDRQQVIDAIHYEYDDCCNIDESGSAIADDIERIIDNVPSVQPDIIHCRDCIYGTDCGIQSSAQAGGYFFCGFGEKM